MRWFVLVTGLLLLGGLTLCGYGTMIWLAYLAEPQLTVAQAELLATAQWLMTVAQAELLATAQWLTRNGAIMLGAFVFGWLAGQVR